MRFLGLADEFLRLFARKTGLSFYTQPHQFPMLFHRINHLSGNPIMNGSVAVLINSADSDATSSGFRVIVVNARDVGAV